MRPIAAEHTPHAAAGFTLVELIVSIALIGLLSMAAIPLLKLPLEGWMDATRRATLSTELDIVHAKLRDDLALAMPGSVRTQTVGGRVLLEYLEVRASGRYRAIPPSGASLCPATCSAVGANDVLEASCPETCFVNLSPWDTAPPTLGANDWVVVNPTGLISPYLAGAAGIRSQAVAVNVNGRVDLAPHTFTTLSPRRRFYIVSGPVTYECNPATRQLVRYSNYPITAVQPAAFAGTVGAIVSNRVQACVNSLRYQAAGGNGQGGIVNVLLRLGAALGEPASSEVADMQASFAVSEVP